MKKLFVATVATAAAITVIVVAFATSTLADGYSSSEIELLRQHCGTVRGTLQQLQIADSSARAYVGGIYLTATNSFLTPLNLRLVRNNITAPDLVASQTDLVGARNQFSAAYITYARSLESLIKIDCTSDPVYFFDQLATTREDRTAVEDSIHHLRSTLDQHRSAVLQLRSKL